MTAVVSVETVLLVILVVLVAGLLRSHAEILRRLGPDAGTAHPANGRPTTAQPAAPRAPRRAAGTPAAPINGVTPAGDVVVLDVAAPGAAVLLAFLSSGCSTCAAFWAGLREARLPVGVETVIVTRGPDRERPARLRELAPAGVAVVMSSAAWEEYAVPGSPYFVLVNGAIRGEGVATTWPALSALVADAVADARDAGGTGAGGAARALDVDRTLAGAGIGPDHPSLYPGGRPAT